MEIYRLPIWFNYSNPIKRLLAAIVDNAIALLFWIFLIFIIGFPVVLFVDAGYLPQIDEDVLRNLGIVSLLFAHWFYFAYLESTKAQATFGKRWLELQIIRKDETAVSFWQASLRYLLNVGSFLILGIGFVPALFSTHKQTLADMLTATIVVQK